MGVRLCSPYGGKYDFWLWGIFRLWGNSKLLLNQTLTPQLHQLSKVTNVWSLHWSDRSLLKEWFAEETKGNDRQLEYPMEKQNYNEQPKLQFTSAATFLWCVSWRCNFLLCHLKSVIVWVKYFVTLRFSWCASRCTILVRLRRQIFGSFLVYFTHIKEVWIWFNKIWFN